MFGLGTNLNKSPININIAVHGNMRNVVSMGRLPEKEQEDGADSDSD